MNDAERLAALRDRPVNFDVAGAHTAAEGWRLDHYSEPLPSEAPGPPVPGGPFEIAQDLLRDYEVADPDIVRAVYDHDAPLENRDMLLELRYGPLRVHAGCRTGEITDEERVVDGERLRVWGWPYRTLEGHIEAGEMHWEVHKSLDSGAVAFHVHSFSRPAPTGNLVLRLGFRLVGQRERDRYLTHACQRMRDLTARRLAHGDEAGPPAA